VGVVGSGVVAGPAAEVAVREKRSVLLSIYVRRMIARARNMNLHGCPRHLPAGMDRFRMELKDHPSDSCRHGGWSPDLDCF
jgi:hypothetical protein